jgi:dCMP deaminase
MIIGITGYYSAGKDSVADHLVKRSFIHNSLSDAIREEAKNRKIKITRENLIKLGNELRKKEGPNVLAKRAMKKIDTARHHVVTSIRNKNEILALKEMDNFLLIYLRAPIEKRFERLRLRNREEDPKSVEELKQKELQEQSIDIEQQQLHLATKMADVTINNDGTLEDLHKKLDRFLQDWWPKLCKDRPNWDDYFMNIAHEVAKRSNCMKRHTAAIIVKDKRIISTGYNGTPKGLTNCNEGGCPRCNSFGLTGEDLRECICSHAEENSIIQAAYHGISIKDSTLYTTQSPCTSCVKMIITSGIKEVICNDQYPMDKGAGKLLKKSHVKVRFL